MDQYDYANQGTLQGAHYALEIGEFFGYYTEFYNNPPVTSQYSPATPILNENPTFFLRNERFRLKRNRTAWHFGR